VALALLLPLPPACGAAASQGGDPVLASVSAAVGEAQAATDHDASYLIVCKFRVSLVTIKRLKGGPLSGVVRASFSFSL
jgi:hypothetical protein